MSSITVRFYRFGEPVEVLQVEQGQCLSPGLGQLLVRMAATPINYSGTMDSDSRKGFAQATLMGMRKHYTVAFKAQVVQEILKEDRTIAQISAEFGVHAIWLPHLSRQKFLICKL